MFMFNKCHWPSLCSTKSQIFDNLSILQCWHWSTSIVLNAWRTLRKRERVREYKIRNSCNIVDHSYLLIVLQEMLCNIQQVWTCSSYRIHKEMNISGSAVWNIMKSESIPGQQDFLLLLLIVVSVCQYVSYEK